MSQPMVSTDADLEPTGDLPLPTLKPYGHFVANLHTEQRPFILVSEARGLLGYFADEGLAQPFLRMLLFNAHHDQGRLDFALWKWDGFAWQVHQRTLPLQEVAA